MFLSLHYIVSFIVNYDIIYVQIDLQLNCKSLDDSNHELHCFFLSPQYPTFPNSFILSLIILPGSIMDGGDTKMNKTWSPTSLSSQCKMDSQWNLTDRIKESIDLKNIGYVSIYAFLWKIYSFHQILKIK